jgi:hypothetical protein
MILEFAQWRYEDRSPQASPSFRLCAEEDIERVLDFVETTCARQEKMGWYDQYLSITKGPNVKDVVLGIENNSIIAVALTYTPSSGSLIASNLPWAGRIGNNVGGDLYMHMS